MGRNFDEDLVVEIDVSEPTSIPAFHECFRELKGLVTRVSDATGRVSDNRFRERLVHVRAKPRKKLEELIRMMVVGRQELVNKLTASKIQKAQLFLGILTNVWL